MSPRGAADGSTIRILLIESSIAVVRQVQEYAASSRGPSFLVEAVSSLSIAQPRLHHGSIDVVVVALDLPDASGPGVVERIFQIAPDLPIVTLAADDRLEDAVLRLAAQDYLDKRTMTAASFLRSLRYAIQRNCMERAVRSREGSFRAVVTKTVDGVVVIDQTGTILFANPAAERLFGKSPGSLMGASLGIPVAKGGKSNLELGDSRHVEMRAADTTWEGAPAYTILLRDVTEQVESRDSLENMNRELQAANARLEQLAHVDPLTDLLNRRGFEHVLEEEVGRSRRTGSWMAAALVDCDDFKQINDGFGHDVGDFVLKEIARRLRLALRPTDRVARVGGDEFLVLLPETRQVEAAHVAERLRHDIAESPVATGERDIAVTASLALVDVGGDIDSLRDILSATHDALRSSKSGGKNRVTMGRISRGGAPNQRDGAQDLKVLESVENLSTVYQPIYDLLENRAIACELLTRGPKGELESPVDFFRLCFQERCVAQVDLTCLEACARAASFVPIVGRVHINLFPHTLVDVPIQSVIDRLVLGVGLERYCHRGERAAVRRRPGTAQTAGGSAPAVRRPDRDRRRRVRAQRPGDAHRPRARRHQGGSALRRGRRRRPYQARSAPPRHPDCDRLRCRDRRRRRDLRRGPRLRP